ncbi:MAG: 5'/3'-nucleotidase SurE [Actinomycetota bacterium]
MNILVTNDDGIESVGLQVLARDLASVGHVTVCAPDREYSGASVAIGSIHQLRPTVRRHDLDGIAEAWSVDGPPALCVMLALADMFDKKFDLVVSGINPGANTGRNVYHSGTVGAVIVGRMYGLSGVAISQASPVNARFGQTPADDVGRQLWASAAHVAKNVVADLAGSTPIEPVVVNVNVPNRPLDKITGVRRTRVARESHRDGTRVSLEPHPTSSNTFNASFAWGSTLDMPLDTDVGAVSAGLVSVSCVGYLCSRDLYGETEHETSIGDRLAVAPLLDS